MSLREIEERHLLDERLAKGGALRTTISSRILREDRAFLLAEVKRLKALCGRVEKAKVCPCVECSDYGWLVDSDLIAELKEASE